jgi:GTP-binding protein HflX
MSRCLIVHPTLTRHAPELDHLPRSSGRSPESRLEEAVGLARAIDLTVTQTFLVTLDNRRPGTYLGAGKVQEIAATVEEASIDVVIVDASLTPIQQRNLERAWKTKVIDRTGLILEIFGERAATREGRLQVELAHLTYQRSRLVRSWTHLERQRGGVGFLGGPGETQIESDRRVIGEKITKLRRQLESVKRTRDLHRKARKKVPYPIVALVGYTNAGKSTLFNKLTGAGVHAQDQLFATLDPTMRALTLPNKGNVILSDTVGFISDLPTQLIAAFRATLEEVIGADVIVHVLDASNPEVEDQRQDVLRVLSEIGVDCEGMTPMIEVMNKTDQIDPEELAVLIAKHRRAKAIEGTVRVAVSALTGDGLNDLMVSVQERISGNSAPLFVKVKPEDGALVAWLHENVDVSDSRYDENGNGVLSLMVDVREHDAVARRVREKGGRVVSHSKKSITQPTKAAE